MNNNVNSTSHRVNFDLVSLGESSSHENSLTLAKICFFIIAKIQVKIG